MEAFIKVDFHSHTSSSLDCLLKPEKLISRARERGLDRIVITDHNAIEGALFAKKLDPELVIVGEEVQTTSGELLAVFVKDRIPGGLKPLEAVNRLKDQGAFISVSHPMDRYRGWKLDDLVEILPHVDAIETFNARCLHAEDNVNAQILACKYEKPGTMGSDAHSAFEVGKAYMRLPVFTSADELRDVIGKGALEGNESPAYVHLFTTAAVHLKKIYRRFQKTQSLDVTNS